MNSKTCNFVCLFHLLISSTSIMDYILVCIGQFVAVTSSEFTIDICCQKLLDVPQDINNSITSLDLKWNRIRQIMENAFDDLYLLEFLNLDFNKVSYISPKAFRNNHVLHYIKLYDHRLMAIPEQFGEAADSLVRLEMKVRSKHILQSVNFTDYPLLEWVSFTKSAPANGVITLKNLPSLKLWYGEHCALTSFPNFSEAPHLEKANLHTGFFPLIPQEYLAGSTKLKHLNLPNGQLNRLPGMKNMVSLLLLNIQNNKLTTLPDLYHLPLRSVTMLHNPWVCDVALCWVRMWPFIKKSSIVTVSMDPICNLPTEAAGTPLMERHPVDMECYKGKFKNIKYVPYNIYWTNILQSKDITYWDINTF